MSKLTKPVSHQVIHHEILVEEYLDGTIGGSITGAELQRRLNVNKVATAIGSVIVPEEGLGIPSGAILKATNQRIFASSGDLTQDVGLGMLIKTTNTTTKVVNPNNQEDFVEADMIVYVSPDGVGMIGDNTISGYETKIEDVTLQGNAPNEVGIGVFVLNGGGHVFNRVQAHRVKYGLFMKEAWLTNVFRFHTWGAIRQDGGTSTHYDNCWARGHKDVLGAFRFTNLNYSVLDSCCSDIPRKSAFYFKNCIALTLNSCATEGPGYFDNLTEEEGSAIVFDSGNRVTLNNFQISPLSGNTKDLITIGDNNRIIINRLFTNNGQAYTGADIYVYGDDSEVVVTEAQVRAGKRVPLVHIKPGCTGKVIVTLPSGNRCVFTAGESKEQPKVEYEYDSGFFNPVLSFGGNSGAIQYNRRSGSWKKSGNIVTVNLMLELKAKGGNTGIVGIGNLPFQVPAHTAASISNYSGVVNAGSGLVASAEVKGSTLNLRKPAGSAMVAASDADVGDSFVISLSYTHYIDSNFEVKPA